MPDLHEIVLGCDGESQGAARTLSEWIRQGGCPALKRLVFFKDDCVLQEASTIQELLVAVRSLPALEIFAFTWAHDGSKGPAFLHAAHEAFKASPPPSRGWKEMVVASLRMAVSLHACFLGFLNLPDSQGPSWHPLVFPRDIELLLRECVYGAWLLKQRHDAGLAGWRLRDWRIAMDQEGKVEEWGFEVSV